MAMSLVDDLSKSLPCSLDESDDESDDDELESLGIRVCLDLDECRVDLRDLRLCECPWKGDECVCRLLLRLFLRRLLDRYQCGIIAPCATFLAALGLRAALSKSDAVD